MLGKGSVCCGRETGDGRCVRVGGVREMREGTVRKRNEEGDGGGIGRGNTVVLILK